jgi:endonuclease G
MKNLWFTLLLVCLSVISSGQTKLRDSVNYQTPNFRIVYSEVLEQPKWVRYTVLCPDGKASRKGMDFYTESSVITSSNPDYVNNEWDKGHMAPAADFNCTTEMLRQTFSFVNCALQNESLNRGAWRLLEAYERELAKTNQVSVYIKLDFGKNVLPTGANVPTGFYKEIKTPKDRLCFYFKNEKPVSTDFNKYKCNCK